MKYFSRNKDDDLISKRELLKCLRVKHSDYVMREIFGKDDGFPVSDEVIAEIEKFPCAEKRPIGHWIMIDDEFGLYRCSKCGEEEIHNRKHVKYCGSCGAEMDYIIKYIGQDGKEHDCG